MGKFKKGLPRAEGAGRKAGTPNKVNSEAREAITDLVCSNVSKLENWLNKVAEENPAKAFDLVIKMMEFVLPKQSRVEYREPEIDKKQPSKIVVEKRNKTVSLDEVADMIDGRANGRIIHFGSCRTLETDGWELRRFLKKTNALAVSGYTADVDFVRSSVFDLIYFQQCQTTTSIRKISEEMKRYYKNLGAELGFKIKDYR